MTMVVFMIRLFIELKYIDINIIGVKPLFQ